MIDALFVAVLPVFALLVIGFTLGRSGLYTAALAAGVNRFVFLVAIPALLFGLLARSPFKHFAWTALFGFVLIELTMYAAGFLIARFLFRRGLQEALLIGLATAFANHLLFVLPIAVNLFGPGAAIPITAIATVDALFIYGGTLLLMDALSEDGASPARILKAFAKNPQILATLGGLVVGLWKIELAHGFYVFTSFAGGTAAPCSLFALGVILSQQKFDRDILLPLAISILKLFVYPLAGWLVIVGLLDIQMDWAKPSMMVAAAPSSAMAFVLALNYRVPTGTIARIISLTMLGALFTVTLATSIPY